MLELDHRTYPRVVLNKSLSYNCLDNFYNVIERYLGTALNISQNGIQLATDRIIKSKHIVLMFFDFKGDYVESKGKVVYSIPDEYGEFKTGINFQGTLQENFQFIEKLVKSYHYQKKVPIFISGDIKS